MIEDLGLRGVALVRGARHHDERGFLRKVLVTREAEEHGLDTRVAEVVSTANEVAGTIRGMHYQVAPAAEVKTLWVTDGSLLDVLVDLRPEEPTYGRWISVELSADDDVALHVPAGIAHGYQTLEDDTRLTYLISAGHSPEHARTLQWDDPTVAIEWPLPPTRISAKDREGHAWPPAP
ncbi:dTDP-4-dehydrorhamnose 3,5-epimerase family protein [Nocardioides KLBMP 9356]|uniref:dTDP-4-dehydrorhamnose 3,5-epimerase family protein n=1 Tax=Nocardioides potassii TaxID=2911371 RepID=A0ABS9H9V0_9ACTN|nr:dTDP-4-dehydrorhamnose 3,5-epimerase family protein [Nocardioides potassii]MCF6377000.1 dTDP-4-dehydrorhamnose 3,5-epimerase family protein [Nocardioides potassii]